MTENSIRVLSLFTDGFDRDYYIREVERLAKVSPRTAQTVLEGLESKGILRSQTRGKIKSYRLLTNPLSIRYLVFAEQHKALSLLQKNVLVREIVEKVSSHIEGIGMIFGSYAKYTAGKGSDVDVFIAGTYDATEIKKISRLLGVEIHIHCYPQKLFERNVKNDVFLKEVLRSHIVFMGAEQFVRTVLSDG
jgi:uncharacterized protein